MTGDALSLAFPPANPIQSTFGGGNVDGFVAKLDPTGSTLIYSTYLGGTGNDVGTAIAVNNAGNAHVTGWTRSNNFPVVNPVINTNSGTMHAFVTKFHPSGTSLVYSTCLGSYGSASGGWGIAVDEAGSTYIAGRTNSTVFPMINPIQSANAGPIGTDDVFIAKISDNEVPVANAGPDQSPHVTEVVTLNGTGSTDVDGDLLTYTWAFTTRPQDSNAQLSDVHAVNPTFTVDKAGTYVVSLMVNDGTVNSIPDTVSISTINTAPIADAGPDQSIILIGSTVHLDGSQSYDLEGDDIAYQWAFVSKPAGSSAILSNADTTTPAFVADIRGEYVIQLVVMVPRYKALQIRLS